MGRDDVTYTDSDGADRSRACTRKKGYPSEEVARFAVATIRSMDPQAAVRVYGCRFCGQWHVGGTPRRDRFDADARGTVETAPDSTSFDTQRFRRTRGPGKSTRRRPAGEGYSPRTRRPQRRRHALETDDDDN